jgi:hypothetical protein
VLLALPCQASAGGQLLLGGAALAAYTAALLLWRAGAKWAILGRLQPHPGFAIYSGLSWRRMLMGAVELVSGMGEALRFLFCMRGDEGAG